MYKKMWCTNTVIQTVVGLIDWHDKTKNVKPKCKWALGNQGRHPLIQVSNTHTLSQTE